MPFSFDKLAYLLSFVEVLNLNRHLLNNVIREIADLKSQLFQSSKVLIHLLSVAFRIELSIHIEAYSPSLLCLDLYY